MKNVALFRSAAADAQQTQWLGSIVLARPLSFACWCVTAIVMIVVVLGFMFFGTYTRRSTVSGHLVPNVGVLKIYTPQSGTAVEKYVTEGQRLRKGDLLYIISSEREITSGGIQKNNSEKVRKRQRSLLDEIQITQQLHENDARTLQIDIANLRAEKENLKNQLVTQRARQNLAEVSLKRASELLQQGYQSPQMVNQQQVDFLEQTNRVESLERELINVQRRLDAQLREQSSLPSRQRNILANLERQLLAAEQEWVDSEGKRDVRIIATKSGVATALGLQIGQTVDGSTPILTIIPEGSTLQAHFYAPSRAIGFVRPGNKVLLRFQAYPYQKFGHSTGIVESISLSALGPNELVSVPNGVASDTEPLYRIIVSVPQQFILAYGQSRPLQAGMLAEADILLEERRLFEWVIEPLVSVTGRF